MAAATIEVGAGMMAMAAVFGAAAVWVAIASFASVRSLFKVRSWSCIMLTKHSILGSVLFLEDLFNPPGGCDDFFHCLVAEILDLGG